MQRSFRGEVLPLRMLHMEHIAVASTCVQWQCCLVEVEPDRIIAPISHCLQKGRPCEEEADLKKRRKKNQKWSKVVPKFGPRFGTVFGSGLLKH
jgi:hypothetical protein